MSPPRERVSPAILLRKVDYGDADQVVTLLTEAFGKRTMFARSARKSRRRFAGGLEPMRLMEVRYRDGRSDSLALLTQSRVLESFDAIASDLHRLYWASMALEWVNSMTVDGEVSPVFETAVELLRWLTREARGAWFIEAGCLRFGLVLLAHSGFLPELSRCVRTGVGAEEIDRPHFSAIAGGLLDAHAVQPEDRARAISHEAIAFLATLYEGRFPPDRAVETLREARERVIDTYRSIVDSEPRSLAMLKSVWI